MLKSQNPPYSKIEIKKFQSNMENSSTDDKLIFTNELKAFSIFKFTITVFIERVNGVYEKTKME